MPSLKLRGAGRRQHKAGQPVCWHACAAGSARGAPGTWQPHASRASVMHGSHMQQRRQGHNSASTAGRPPPPPHSPLDGVGQPLPPAHHVAQLGRALLLQECLELGQLLGHRNECMAAMLGAGMSGSIVRRCSETRSNRAAPAGAPDTRPGHGKHGQTSAAAAGTTALKKRSRSKGQQ